MKILLAADGSEFSRAAVERVCEDFIKPENTEIKIISVYQTVLPLDNFEQSARYAEEHERAMRELAKSHADQAAGTIRNCAAEAKVELSVEVVLGAADRAVLETAENWKADLIVTGTHGRGFWGRNLIGSVSDAIIHHAPCSVLIVRKKS